MQFLLRFLLPLGLILGGLSYGLLPLVDHLTTKWAMRDLDIRSRLIVNTLQRSLVPLLNAQGQDGLAQALEILRKTTQDERLIALAVCTPAEKMLLQTELFPQAINCSSVRHLEPYSGILAQLPGGAAHVAFGYLEEKSTSGSFEPIGNNIIRNPSGGLIGRLILLHDLSFVSRRSSDTKTYIFIVFLCVGLLISAITVVVARWSMATWIRSVRDLVLRVRADGSHRQDPPVHKDFMPILKDLRGLVRDLEETAQEKDEAGLRWDAKSLKEILHHELAGNQVIVVSNRQPYIHNKSGKSVEIQCPASGLVTALEPILKACSGVWIAHGNGSADREVVDESGKIAVPPEHPQYEIQRVWLNDVEEKGYYYGFSNEGLWPLCHIAHTRPIFRKADWDQYVAVNAKFADAVISNAKSEDPVVLVQDYHLALVPRLLRSRMPNATVITFWHIPWPNPESFGICPWREELLDGLLGSSIIGFHTQFHCNNFMDSIDRFLEARVDRETNSVSYRRKITGIRPYPISIEWPPERLASIPRAQQCREELCRENNLSIGVKICVGIDRLDYTKGIIERFRAFERVLEMHPALVGNLVFVQLAAPTRSTIPAYHQFENEVRMVVDEINNRYGSDGYLPIMLKISHHEPIEVFRYLRAADICVVSSLHDGMNLVAKEFIAAREDEKGVLILSMFAGASRELAEALIINPYDVEETARAIHIGLIMPEHEQRERMRSMRGIVKEFNVYRWAGRMLLDAAKVRRRNRFLQRVGRYDDCGDMNLVQNVRAMDVLGMVSPLEGGINKI